jgi:microsomal dipeptidase-like Zn-dependent dipeptidase
MRRIAAREGVAGLILAQHQLNDGIRRSRTKSFDESIEVICKHLDRIAEIAGSHEYAAIGSDLDGFIKPILAGLEDAQRLGALQTALTGRYGHSDGELIASGNVLRLLRSQWRIAPSGGSGRSLV